MIEVREVKTKKEQKEFLNFPLRLYQGHPYFVPPLYGDEKQIFSRDYPYYEMAEAVYYNAYRDGTMAGRISGILHHVSNDLRGEKRVRFTRFDSIDDVAVARALFDAVETWALSKGMDTVHGPLGFSDLEREGLLVDGFDEMSTFSEQYNYPYYAALIEQCGYGKETDWIAGKLYTPPEEEYARLQMLSAKCMERNGFQLQEIRDIDASLKQYADALFDLLDEGYAELYGSVPFTPRARQMILKNFRAVLDPRYFGMITDRDGNIVCFGLCYPWIGGAIQKSAGHLTPPALLKLLKAIRKPRILELGLIVVSPEHRKLGVNAIICAGLAEILKKSGVEYAETNVNLEDNLAIRKQWKHFRYVEHKRRRAYVKSLNRGKMEA